MRYRSIGLVGVSVSALVVVAMLVEKVDEEPRPRDCRTIVDEILRQEGEGALDVIGAAAPSARTVPLLPDDQSEHRSTLQHTYPEGFLDGLVLTVRTCGESEALPRVEVRGSPVRTVGLIESRFPLANVSVYHHRLWIDGLAMSALDLDLYSHDRVVEGIMANVPTHEEQAALDIGSCRRLEVESLPVDTYACGSFTLFEGAWPPKGRAGSTEASLDSAYVSAIHELSGERVNHAAMLVVEPLPAGRWRVVSDASLRQHVTLSVDPGFALHGWNGAEISFPHVD